MKWLFGKFLHTGVRVKQSRTLTLFASARPRRVKKPVVPRFLEAPGAQA